MCRRASSCTVAVAYVLDSGCLDEVAVEREGTCQGLGFFMGNFAIVVDSLNPAHFRPCPWEQEQCCSNATGDGDVAWTEPGGHCGCLWS